jgi:AcrR family transcriptional regulator
MATGSTAAKEPVRRASRGARERVLDAALELFSEHGVSGTSLQMIADRIGVTKAAVYHQFHTKDEIVLAVLTPALDQLQRDVEEAERQPTPELRRDNMLAALVSLAVGHRRIAAIIHADPTASEMVRQRMTPDVGPRIRSMLDGPDPDVRTHIAGAMVGGALMMIGISPELQGYDDDELAHHLLDIARDLFGRTAS